jgi:succinate dehydrogenase / fumarate reductase membrane anchor subunit
MRTPLSQVRGRGSAKFGTDDYWVQRLTAAVLVPLSIVFIVFLVRNGAAPHAAVREALANPICAIGLAAAIIAGVLHMRIGMQVIIEDYVHGQPWSVLSIVLNWLFSALIVLATLWAVAKLSFGM